MAATLLLQRPWLAQSPCLLAATTLARETAVRAVVALLASLCTPPTCLEEEDSGEKPRKIRGKQNKGLAMKYFSLLITPFKPNDSNFFCMRQVLAVWTRRPIFFSSI
jgi:hypothetical protein